MSTAFEPAFTKPIVSPTRVAGPVAALRNRFAAMSPDAWRFNGSGLSKEHMANDITLFKFVSWIAESDLYDKGLAEEFLDAGLVRCLKSLRQLQFVLSMDLRNFLSSCCELARELDSDSAGQWREIVSRQRNSSDQTVRVFDVLLSGRFRTDVEKLRASLAAHNPHAIYPTTTFRTSDGHVVANEDYSAVEAVMSSNTHTSIRIAENVLDPTNPTLLEVYAPHRRCVCLVDQNVEQHYAPELDRYFAANEIRLEKLVYRAMEVDKGIQSVERILGDFKRLGVARNEPVLVVGGGVLTDIGGLACGLYHRGTPYVMLSTSLVAGIDAGPSPRTCCDGFGFKNLFGAYHAPILSITDRMFFRTLKRGWLRHGIAEIIKMACVKDEVLFAELELAGKSLIDTRFGTINCEADVEIQRMSQSIIGRAITSYVDAEYGNLYETHQCRPHAFGHTWSPGYEIPAGLLHGHAVSIGMGFGAYVSQQLGWISESEMDRIHCLIQSFDLSLWHESLNDHDLIWSAQQKMMEKRGGQLVAPLPMHQIGRCGYLEKLERDSLVEMLNSYGRLCARFPRNGLGIEPLCSDVGLESPSTVGV